jgi:hypothetical protein
MTEHTQIDEQWLDETFTLIRRAFDEAEANPAWWPQVAGGHEVSWILTHGAPPADPRNYDVRWLVLYFAADGRVDASTAWHMGARGGEPYLEPAMDPEADPRYAVVLPEDLAGRARDLRARALGGF